MILFYRLVDGRPVAEPDIMAWGRWMETADRHLAKTTVPRDDGTEALVSTVFLGTDHSGGIGAPELYETMIFGLPDDDQPLWRYATREEAVAGHERACAYARGKQS